MAYETHKCNSSCRHRKLYGRDQRGNPTPTLTSPRGKFAILGTLSEYNARISQAWDEVDELKPRVISRNVNTPIEMGVLDGNGTEVLAYMQYHFNSIPHHDTWLPLPPKSLVYLECETAADLPRIVDSNGLIIFDAIRPWIEDYGPGTYRTDIVSA